MTQVVEHLTSKHKFLSSNSSTTKRIKVTLVYLIFRVVFHMQIYNSDLLYFIILHTCDNSSHIPK
jgi:hypothetical protein